MKEWHKRRIVKMILAKDTWQNRASVLVASLWFWSEYRTTENSWWTVVICGINSSVTLYSANEPGMPERIGIVINSSMTTNTLYHGTVLIWKNSEDLSH